MRTKRIGSYVAIGLILIAGWGCGGTKKLSNSKESAMIGRSFVLPCEKDSEPSKKYFRSHGVGESQSLDVAKQKAYLHAKREIATVISTRMKAVTDEYVNERKLTGANEFKAKFENLTREVLDQELNNIEKICSVSTQLDNGMFRQYLAIQIEKEMLLSNINTRLSSRDKIELDYDKQKYEEIYNREMDALAKEKGL